MNVTRIDEGAVYTKAVEIAGRLAKITPATMDDLSGAAMQLLEEYGVNNTYSVEKMLAGLFEVSVILNRPLRQVVAESLRTWGGL